MADSLSTHPLAVSLGILNTMRYEAGNDHEINVTEAQTLLLVQAVFRFLENLPPTYPINQDLIDDLADPEHRPMGVTMGRRSGIRLSSIRCFDKLDNLLDEIYG